MTYQHATKDVRFLSDKPTANWGLGGWSLALFTIAMVLNFIAFNKAQAQLACVFSLCTEPIFAQGSTLITIVSVAIVLWLGAIIMAVFGCITKSNTLASGLVLFLSLVPTVYVALELVRDLFTGLLA